jgi:hypothetical protein
MSSEIPTPGSWIVPQNKWQEMQEKNENFSCKKYPVMISSSSLKTGDPLRLYFTGVRYKEKYARTPIITGGINYGKEVKRLF